MLLDLWPTLTDEATGGSLPQQKARRRTYRDHGTFRYTTRVTATAHVETSGQLRYAVTATGVGWPRTGGVTTVPAPTVDGTPVAARAAAAVNLTTRTRLTLTDQRHIEPDWLLLELLDE